VVFVSVLVIILEDLFRNDVLCVKWDYSVNAQHQQSVLAPVYQSLVVALVLSRLDCGNITLIGIPAYQLCHLLSVMNAAARLIAGLRRSDHITDMLVSLHWLRSSECIQYKLAMTVFRSLHGLAPPYLSDDLHRLVDIPSRRRLRSASSLQLDVPCTHRRTIGDRAFAAASPALWNSLPHDITDCVSHIILLETENFFVFYIISMTTFFFLVVLEVFT